MGGGGVPDEGREDIKERDAKEEAEKATEFKNIAADAAVVIVVTRRGVVFWREIQNTYTYLMRETAGARYHKEVLLLLREI